MLNKKLTKSKVIHFMTSLEIGGMENGVVNLVNNMDPTKFDFFILCYTNEGGLKKRLKSGIRCFCLNSKRGINVFALLRVWRIIKRIRPDIVHTHGWGSGSLYGIIGAKLAGVPVVINGEHGILYSDRKLRVIAQKVLSSLTDCIIPVSNDLKKDLVCDLGLNPKKIFPIINGVDTVKFCPDYLKSVTKRKSLNIDSDNFVVGSVGRLVDVKDYESLIYSASLVVKDYPVIKFILVGDGILRKKLEVLVCSLNLNKNFIFLGQRDDIPELLNILDVFVLSSIDEGLSNVILEAMACGKPIIATAVGGNIELIEHKRNGILVPIRDSHKIAEEIINLFKNKEMVVSMGRDARRSAVERFSMHRMVRNYEVLYHAYLKKVRRE